MLMGGVGTVFPLQFLVQGGANESDPLASAEIYDPSTSEKIGELNDKGTFVSV